MTPQTRSALSRVASVFGGLSAFLRASFIVITVLFMGLKSAAPEMRALYAFLGVVFLLVLSGLFYAWVQLAARQTLWLKPDAPSDLAKDLSKFPDISFVQSVGLLWLVWVRPHQEGLKKPSLKPKKGSRIMLVFVLALMAMGGAALPMALAYLIAALSLPFVPDVTKALTDGSVGATTPNGVQAQMTSANATVQHGIPASPVTPQSAPLFKAQPNVVQRRGQKPSGDDFVIWKR
jgi:hypothetical protein